MKIFQAELLIAICRPVAVGSCATAGPPAGSQTNKAAAIVQAIRIPIPSSSCLPLLYHHTQISLASSTTALLALISTSYTQASRSGTILRMAEHQNHLP